MVASAFEVHSDRCLRRVRTVETPPSCRVHPYLRSTCLSVGVCIAVDFVLRLAWSLGIFRSLWNLFRSRGYWLVNRVSGTGGKICRTFDRCFVIETVPR